MSFATVSMAVIDHSVAYAAHNIHHWASHKQSPFFRYSTCSKRFPHVSQDTIDAALLLLCRQNKLTLEGAEFHLTQHGAKTPPAMEIDIEEALATTVEGRYGLQNSAPEASIMLVRKRQAQPIDTDADVLPVQKARRRACSFRGPTDDTNRYFARQEGQETSAVVNKPTTAKTDRTVLYATICTYVQNVLRVIHSTSIDLELDLDPIICQLCKMHNLPREDIQSVVEELDFNGDIAIVGDKVMLVPR